MLRLCARPLAVGWISRLVEESWVCLPSATGADGPQLPTGPARLITAMERSDRQKKRARSFERALNSR